MKYFLVCLLLFAFCAGAAAQQKRYEFQEECGDPSVESVLFTVHSGKVVEIIDGDSIVIKLSNGKKKTIDLTGISSATNEAAAKAFLTGKLLKKKVELSMRGFDLKKADRIWGVVTLDGLEINRLMIENGIAVFKQPAPYAYSTYGTCVYQKLEEKAKREKTGIWAK